MHRFLLLMILLGSGFQVVRPAAIPNKASASSTKEPQVRRILEKMDRIQLVDLVITIAEQANRNCQQQKTGESPTSVTTLETEIDKSAPGSNVNLEIASLVEELLNNTTAGIEPVAQSPGKAIAGTPSSTGQSVQGSDKVAEESAGTEANDKSTSAVTQGTPFSGDTQPLVESPSDEGSPSDDTGATLEVKSTFKVQLINTHPLCVERLYQPNVTSLASIRTQKDVIEYLIYRLCLSSVTTKDLKAIATIIRQMVKGMLSPAEKPTTPENLGQPVPTTSAPSREATTPPNIDEGAKNAENGPNSSLNPTTRVPDSNADTLPNTSAPQAAQAPVTIASRDQPFTKRSDAEVLRALEDILVFEYAKN